MTPTPAELPAYLTLQLATVMVLIDAVIREEVGEYGEDGSKHDCHCEAHTRQRRRHRSPTAIAYVCRSNRKLPRE